MPKAKTTKTKKKTKAVKKTKEKKKKIEKPEKAAKEVKKEKAVESDRYIEAVGRRKRAVARIRIFTKGENGFSINKKPFKKYFPTFELQKTALASLEKMKCLDKFNISVVIRGGGLNAQAEAVRHGTARALLLFNPDFRKRLKKAGFLKRDSRMRERKKPGLKRARRAPQWKKR
ncbi:MAG: 30S ribosomal protein S9 [Candidatus Nealsonbacteria bacterium]